MLVTNMNNLSVVGRASAVPVDFPLPSHHPWIRLNGLHRWFLKLHREDSVVFHRFLFNFDLNQQTPAEALYLQALNTASVIAVYDMCDVNSRIEFDTLVSWAGVPDTRPIPPSNALFGVNSILDLPLPPVSSAPVSSTGARGETRVVPVGSPAAKVKPGDYDCYTVLFRDTAVDAVREKLGANPWAPLLASELLDSPGVWADGKFSLTLGLPLGPSPRGSPAFVQAHVVACDKGMTVRQLVPFLSGHVRVGATPDLSAALSIAKQSDTPAIKPAFDIRSKSPSHQMTFSVYGIVGADTKKYPSITFSPMGTPTLVIMLGIYESVRLDSARFTITVDKGSGNSVWCAMSTAGVSLKTIDDWYSAPVMAVVDGSDNGVVRGEFEMPAVTSFSREYRATTLGNPPAKFVFSYTGAAETTGTIQGIFTVTLSGQRLMNRVNIGGATPLTAMRNFVATIQNQLDYEVDEDDCAPGARVSQELVAADEDDE